jgi:hypothetical protein
MHDWANHVGPGWKRLVDPLIEQANKEGVKILQVKEKFAGLRFYCEDGSKKLYKMIIDAEAESFLVCEDCGAPGRLVTIGSWLKTLCKTHEKFRKRERKELDEDEDYISTGSASSSLDPVNFPGASEAIDLAIERANHEAKLRDTE